MDWLAGVNANRTHVMDEIIFCEELMNRLFESVYGHTDWKKEQVKADILRLRRELNILRKFMDDNTNQL